MRHFVMAAVALWLGAQTLLAAQPTPAPQAAPAAPSEPLPVQKYNVLFIVSDDLSTALGCYGNKVVQTPNLDALAKRSLLFDRAYCQYPLCNPSRASFLSGLRCHHTKVLNHEGVLRKNLPEVVTLPQLYQQNGYSVARVGKLFHAVVPGDIGADGLDDAASWQKVVNPRGRDKDETAKVTTVNNKPDDGATMGWLAAEGTDEEQTDAIGAAEAIKLLEEYREKPFFLGVGFFRPHTPLVAPKKYFDMYPLDKIQVPKAPADDWADIPSIARAQYGDRNPANEAQAREAIRAYYASVSFMDAQVGKLVAAVDRLGLAEKTIIVFLSDHGYHLGEHGLWQKLSLFEESTRVPLLISVPGMKTGGQSTKGVVELIDIYPTLAGLCGLKLPKEGVDGTTLTPLLENAEADWRGAAVSQVLRLGGKNLSPRPGVSIRTQRWRFTVWEGGKGLELYDHDRDPREMSNVARDPRYRNVVDFHFKLLNNVMEGRGDKPPE